MSKYHMNLRPCPHMYSISFFSSINIYKQNYITGNSDLTTSNIIFNYNSFSVLSYVNGVMRRIFYLIFITPHCNVTIPLFRKWVISNGPLYVVSYLKELLLFIMYLSPTYSRVIIFYYFSRCHFYSFVTNFSDILISNPPFVLLGESCHGQILIYLYYNLLTYLL